MIRQLSCLTHLSQPWSHIGPAFLAARDLLVRCAMAWSMTPENSTVKHYRKPSCGLPHWHSLLISRLMINIPMPHLETDDKSTFTSLNALNLTAPTTPVLVLCPGAEYGPAKQWPARHFAKLANHYLDLGWQVWLLGSVKDDAI